MSSTETPLPNNVIPLSRHPGFRAKEAVSRLRLRRVDAGSPPTPPHQLVPVLTEPPPVTLPHLVTKTIDRTTATLSRIDAYLADLDLEKSDQRDILNALVKCVIDVKRSVDNLVRRLPG